MEWARAEEPSSVRRSTGMSCRSGITVSMSFSDAVITSLRMGDNHRAWCMALLADMDACSAGSLSGASIRGLRRPPDYKSVHPWRRPVDAPQRPSVDGRGRPWTCDGCSDTRPTPIRDAVTLHKTGDPQCGNLRYPGRNPQCG